MKSNHLRAAVALVALLSAALVLLLPTSPGSAAADEDTGSVAGDEGLPVVSAISQLVTETDRNQAIRVAIELDRPATRTVRVRYTTVAGTATQNRDYSRRSGLITIPRNQTSRLATIIIRGDDEDEPTETFEVVLSAPTNAELGANATILIDDDDEPFVPPVISALSTTVTETNRAQTVRVTVRLDRPAERTARVRYTTVAGTATQNQDYNRRTGIATIAKNRTEVTIPLLIRGDDLQEPTETLDIVLSAPSQAVLGDNATITIEDDDDPPYPWLGWDEARPRYRAAAPDIHVLDRASIVGDPYDAVVDALSLHGDVRLVGTFDFDRALGLQSGQILRGAGHEQTVLRFSGTGSGIRADLGGISGPTFGVQAATVGSRQLRLDQPNSGAFTIGRLAVLSLSDPDAAPLTVQVVGLPDPYTVALAGPLPRDVAGTEQLMALNRDPVVGVGIDGLSIEAVGDVDRLISFRGVVDGWINDVWSRNPRRSHFDANFSIGCAVSGSFFDDASNHGDGGRGYGVSLANGTVACLVEDNEFRHLRHSMILNDGAAGNALVFNHSWEAHHPNFPAGGPPDILMHGPAYGNLAEGNVVERIFIGDRSTGGGNAFVRNCLTTAPLSYQHGSGVQVLIGNAMYGSDDELRALRMEDRWPDHEPFPGGATTLPFLAANNSIFDGNGVVRITPVGGVDPLPDPFELNNWFDGAPTGPQSSARQPLTVFTGNQEILTGNQSADWRNDCAIEAVTGPGRGVNRTAAQN